MNFLREGECTIFLLPLSLDCKNNSPPNPLSCEKVISVVNTNNFSKRGGVQNHHPPPLLEISNLLIMKIWN